MRFRCWLSSFVLLCSGLLGMALPAHAQLTSLGRLTSDAPIVHTGTLAPGDEQTDGGQYRERFTVEAAAGQPLQIEMTSDSLDTYLMVRTPSRERTDNDNYGPRSRSRVVVTPQAAGHCLVIATTYPSGQTGAYRLTIQTVSADAQQEYARAVRDMARADTLAYVAQQRVQEQRYDEALTLYHESLSIHERLGARRKASLNHNSIGTLHYAEQRYDTAIRHYEEALAIAQATDHNADRSALWANIARTRQAQGDTAAAVAAYREALAADRQRGALPNAAQRLATIAEIHAEDGATEAAITTNEELIALYRQMDDPANGPLNDAFFEDLSAPPPAEVLSTLGGFYQDTERLADAFAAYDEAHAIYQQSGRAVEAAALMGVMGNVRRLQERFSDAEPLLQGAYATLSEAVGADHFYTVLVQRNLGRTLRALDRYREAESAFRDVLAAFEAQYGPDASETVAVMREQASVLNAQGRTDEAAPLYRRVLETVTATRGPEHPVTAQSANNLAVALDDLGRFAEAEALYRQALDVYTLASGSDTLETARTLSNLGHVLQKQGRYDEADRAYRRALRLFVRTRGERHPETATVLNNLAALLDDRERLDDAEATYRQALAILKETRGPEHPDVAATLGNLAGVLDRQARYTEAEMLYRRALTIKEAQFGPDNPLTAIALSNLAAVLVSQDRYDEARPLLRRVREVTEASMGHQHPRTATAYSNLGALHRLQGQYAAAAEALSEAVSIMEHVRLQADGDARRDYLARQVAHYYGLIDTYVRAGQPEQAFQAAEQSQARQLAETLAATDTAFAVPAVADVQTALDADTALLSYANAATGGDLLIFVLTRDAFEVVSVPDSTFENAAFATYGERLASLTRTDRQRQRERLATLGRSSAGTSSSDTYAIVQFYRRLLVDARTPLDTTATDVAWAAADTTRGTRRSGGFADADARDDLARRFYDLLITPAQDALGDASTLIVVPNGPLGFVPFETLLDDRGRYLAETHHVRYTPSATVWLRLQERTYPDTRQPLLALGGAVYSGADGTSRGTSYANAAQVEAAQEQAYARLHHSGNQSATYEALGYGAWSDLPGTRTEVNGLAEVVPGAEVITGADVSEATLKQHSEAGDLAQYRMLHVATHGLVVPEVPELSALVLTQTDTGTEDGYLRMAEIADLSLQADVVTLSACETGLGQFVRGEGVVGLSQAFFEAGANGLSVSLWQVADRSTSALMRGVYRRMTTDGVPFDVALTGVKRAFLRGDYGEQYRGPYYWAPFVYYGRSNQR